LAKAREKRKETDLPETKRLTGDGRSKGSRVQKKRCRSSGRKGGRNLNGKGLPGEKEEIPDQSGKGRDAQQKDLKEIKTGGIQKKHPREASEET